jgi:uncharacterized membrane protein
MIGREFETIDLDSRDSEKSLARKLFPRIFIGFLVTIGVVIVLLVISNQAQAGAYGVKVQYSTPANGVGNVTPAIDFEYTVDIINNGTSNPGEDINFTVEMDPVSVAAGWTVTPSGTTIIPNLLMGPGNKVTEIVTVRAPIDAQFGDSAVINITVDVIGHKGEVGCLDSLQLRANVVQDYGVLMTAVADVKTADPDEEVSFELKITNQGNINDTYSFSAVGMELGEWSEADVILKVQDSIYVYYNITIDPGHDASDIIITLYVSSEEDKSAMTYDTLDITIHVNQVYSLELTSTEPDNTKEGEPGDTQVTFTLRIHNIGTATDSYNLRVTSVDESIFTIQDPISIAYLGVNSYGTTTATVSITPDKYKALAGSYQIEITATSVSDPGVSETIILTVEITPLASVEFNISSQTDNGEPGEEIDYSLQVRNNGNAQDTFELTLHGPNKDWGEIINSNENPITEVTLEAITLPGSFANIIVRVTIPGTGETKADQTYPITIKAASTNTQNVFDEAQVSTRVEDFVDLELEYSGGGTPDKTYDPNYKSPKFSFTVTNNGNQDESSVEIRVDDIDHDWNYYPKTLPDTLDPGGSTIFSLEFTIPSDAPEGEYEMQVVVTSSVDPAEESDPIAIIVTVVKPDLVISSGDISGLDNPDELKRRVGSQLTILVTVRNEGTSKAEHVQVKFYEGSSVKGTTSISSIEPDGHENVTFRWKVVAEEVDLKIEAIPLEESDESNNEEEIYIDLRPNLKFVGEHINLSDPNPKPKDKITITAYIQNNGGDAEDITVTFTYGGKPIGSDTVDIDFGDVGMASVEWDVPDKPGEPSFLEVGVEHPDAVRDEKTSKSIIIGEDDKEIEPIVTEGDLIWITICIIIGIVACLVGYLIGARDRVQPYQPQPQYPQAMNYEDEYSPWGSEEPEIQDQMFPAPPPPPPPPPTDME